MLACEHALLIAHRLEWMLRAGKSDVVTQGNIRFTDLDAFAVLPDAAGQA